jgi:hypothetical protein
MTRRRYTEIYDACESIAQVRIHMVYTKIPYAALEQDNRRRYLYIWDLDFSI